MSPGPTGRTVVVPGEPGGLQTWTTVMIIAATVTVITITFGLSGFRGRGRVPGNVMLCMTKTYQGHGSDGLSCRPSMLGAATEFTGGHRTLEEDLQALLLYAQLEVQQSLSMS